MNEKGSPNSNKFNFVTMDELENEISNFKEIIDKNNKKDVHLYDTNIREKENNTPFRKFYFSFEARVFSMIFLILLLFGGACFLILNAIHFGTYEVITYDESSQVSYHVCLEDNDFYETECLDEDMQYVSSLINTIPVIFDYQIDYSDDVEQSLNYYVSANMIIYDQNDSSKVLYKNEEFLVNKTSVSTEDNHIQFKTEANVNYFDYNDYVLEYADKNNLDVSAVLKVSLFLEDTSETREAGLIELPLGKQTFSIIKSSVKNVNQASQLVNDSWNQYNTICAIIACAMILVSLFLLFRTTRLVLKVTTKRSKYQARLTQILREYDRIIVVARDGYESNVEKPIVKLDHFEELLDARNTLGKPIIYSRINDIKSEFIVEDEDKLYKFVLKELDS